MSMMDYGALLRVDGKLINKNSDLFMETSNTGYMCEQAVEPNGNVMRIKGNYFVYAGDADMMIVFYKSVMQIISHKKKIAGWWNHPFISETHDDPEGRYSNIKVSHLDPELYYEYEEIEPTWQEYVREYYYGCTGNEKLSELENGKKEFKWYIRRRRQIARANRTKTGLCRYRTPRWIAEWEHNGKHYEVIFGYGIDPGKEVWNKIKNKAYDFTDVEREIIDGWFTED